MLQPVDHVVGGVKCAVYDSDPTRREAVVFVHGNPGPMDDWEELASAVAKYARVVAMDMPGYGRAERPKNFNYTIEGYGKYLGALLDQLSVKRAHLVMHDFGGPWALWWASKFPGRVASVTLINSGILEGYKWHTFARIWQTPVLGELAQLTSTSWGMRRALNRMNPKPLPQSFIDRIMKYADWGHKRAVLKLYRASKYIGESSPSLGGFAKKLPACVIWGAGDPFIEVEFAEQQRRYFPLAEVHILEGLGHWPFIDDLDAVRKPLVKFLKQNVGRST